MSPEDLYRIGCEALHRHPSLYYAQHVLSLFMVLEVYGMYEVYTHHYLSHFWYAWALLWGVSAIFVSLNMSQLKKSKVALIIVFLGPALFVGALVLSVLARISPTRVLSEFANTPDQATPHFSLPHFLVIPDQAGIVVHSQHLLGLSAHAQAMYLHTRTPRQRMALERLSERCQDIHTVLVVVRYRQVLVSGKGQILCIKRCF